MRVLLFRECEWTERRILFDSNAITTIDVSKEAKTADKENSGYRNLIEIINGYAYCYGENATDGNAIGEMVYGSIAMTNRGTSLKVKSVFFLARN